MNKKENSSLDEAQKILETMYQNRDNKKNDLSIEEKLFIEMSQDLEREKRDIRLEVLRSIYGHNEKLDERIKEVYEDLNGSKWETDKDKIIPKKSALPGSGINTIFTHTCVEIASALNLHFISEPINNNDNNNDAAKKPSGYFVSLNSEDTLKLPVSLDIEDVFTNLYTNSVKLLKARRDGNEFPSTDIPFKTPVNPS